MMHTPTAEDVLRKEAVDLATDMTSMLVDFKRLLRAEDAYVVAMECVRAADRIQKARLEALPHRTREQFTEARTAVQRAMVALDRAGARVELPAERTEALYRRLHFLALTLGVLARDPED